MTTETLTAKERKTAECAEAIEQLRKDLKEGATVYTILRHCSASGMSRDISLVMVKDGELRNITWYAARAMGYACKLRDGSNVIRVGGCGMDMGFHLVYGLSRTIFAGNPAREDRDSGYVLNHRWL